MTALRDAGPTDWPDQRWYELALDFGHGRYGLIVDSDHYVAYFEDPATSPLAGKIAYAPPPAGPGGERRPNLWTWSVVMNTRARDRDAAWRFVEWATGRAVPAPLGVRGQHEPDAPRASGTTSASARHTVGLEATSTTSRGTLIERDASVLVTPAPNYIAIASRWVEALLAAYAGADVGGALEAAAADIDALV